MRLVELQRVPNQALSFNLDGNRWQVRIKQAKSSMIADVTINEQVIISGARIVGDAYLLPYRYLGVRHGNLLVTVERDMLPTYEQFGLTQFLYYLSPEEMEALSGD